jgi:hypothetical protein
VAKGNEEEGGKDLDRRRKRLSSLGGESAVEDTKSWRDHDKERAGIEAKDAGRN